VTRKLSPLCVFRAPHRRVLVLEAEGIVFKTNVNVGVNYSVEQLMNLNSIVLCGVRQKTAYQQRNRN
jgi:NADPH-dependent glutamate synthase beta subunit-like oxidoreductase